MNITAKIDCPTKCKLHSTFIRFLLAGKLSAKEIHRRIHWIFCENFVNIGFVCECCRKFNRHLSSDKFRIFSDCWSAL